MRGRIRWNVSAAAVLLFALFWFFDDAGLVSALAPAVLAHELGHVVALRACRARLRRVNISVFGIEMDYAGRLTRAGALISVAAGPLAGALYAVATCSTRSEFWRLSGAVSFCLTAFNLLPVLPLDGGRLVAELTDERFAARLSRVSAVILLAGGAAIFSGYRFPGLLMTGIWLCAYHYRGSFLSAPIFHA